MKSSMLSLVLGLALLVGGAYVLLEGGYITSRREVVNIGGLKISAEERHPIRPWAAGLALVAGTALVIVGATRKRS
jgi:hypothetical protein